MPFGNQTLMVSAWLVRSIQPANQADIRFEVVSPGPRPEHLVAHLQWGSDKYETPVKAGAGRFKQLVLPNFASRELSGSAGEFRLSFESLADESE